MASPARPPLIATRPWTQPGVVRSGVVVGVAIAAANALTALTQLVLARLLVPREYSVVVTLFVVITIAGVPLAAVQASVARGVAAELDAAREAGDVIRGAFHELSRMTAIAAAVALIAAVPLAVFLHLDHPWPLVAAAVVIAASAGLAVVWGSLQGTQRFGSFSAGQVAFSAVKLAAATGAAALGASTTGVMSALAASTVTALVAGVVFLRPYLERSNGGRRIRSLATRYSGGAATGLTLFAALTSADVVVARVALHPDESGVYAAASVTGRALLLAPTAIATVLFPKVATLADRRRERRYLLAASAATVTLGAIATFVLWIAGGPVVRLVFGHAYSAAGAWAALLALAMTLYGVAFVYLFHALSVGRGRVWLAVAPVIVVQAAAFALFHSSGRSLAYVQVAIAAILVIVVELYDRRAA